MHFGRRGAGVVERTFGFGIIALSLLAIAPVTAARAQEGATLVSGARVELAPPKGEPVFVEIHPGTALPAGSHLRTGTGGWATLRWGGGAQITLRSGSELVLHGTTWRTADTRGSGAPVESDVSGSWRTSGFAPMQSAIKSILTHNDATVGSPHSMFATFEVGLQRGALIARLHGGTELRVHVTHGVAVTRDSQCSVTIGRNDRARVTVDRGSVEVFARTSGQRVEPGAGQFVEVRDKSPASDPITSPKSAATDRDAKADLAALQSAEDAALHLSNPETEGNDGPSRVARATALATPTPPPAAAVGSGMSVPFDLAGANLLLAPPNGANTQGPVNSPDRP